MRPRRRRPPKALSLITVVNALKAQIRSTDPVCTMRESFNGVPNLRYAAETNGMSWIVDIYLGHFYRAQIGNSLGQTFRNVPALLGYLLHGLGLVPK